MSILGTIKDYKLHEVAAQRALVPESRLRAELDGADPCRGLLVSLARAGIGLIAEIKKASPTRGLIRPDFDAAACAAAYERGGAAALSVLTDSRSFQGSLDDMTAARAVCALPVLRKDFIVDPYQVLESRVWSADAIILMMSVVDRSQAAELHSCAGELGLDVIVEVHTEEQLDDALSFGANAVGINNRDLHTFEADLGTTIRLSARCPDDVLVVSESGIGSRDDVLTLTGHGIRSFLVGESLMRQADLAEAVRDLLPTDPKEH